MKGLRMRSRGVVTGSGAASTEAATTAAGAEADSGANLDGSGFSKIATTRRSIWPTVPATA